MEKVKFHLNQIVFVLSSWCRCLCTCQLWKNGEEIKSFRNPFSVFCYWHRDLITHTNNCEKGNNHAHLWNHRMIGVGKDHLEIVWPLKAGSARVSCPGLCLSQVLNISRDRESIPNLSEQPVPVFHHPCSKKIFLIFKWNFLYFNLNEFRFKFKKTIGT